MARALGLRLGLMAAVMLAWGCDDGTTGTADAVVTPDATAGRLDAQVVDARVIDARVIDAAADPDARRPDAAPDAEVVDAAPDARIADAAPDMSPPACMDADCPPGQVCGADGACADRCVAGACPDGHCAADGRCAPGPCADDVGCAGGAWCTPEGACADGCRTAPDDCGDGRFCDPTTHECVACAEAEICGDGVDNDCNGAVDDACDCVPDQPCETGLPGDCGQGVTLCTGDGVLCRAAGVDEICDGLDNDCDGSADEAWPILGQGCAGGAGVCANRGTWRCGPEGGEPVCAGAEAFAAQERCDRLDNDCDGRIDEAFPDVNRPCAVGEGACAAEGRWRCGDDGAGAVCDANPGPPGSELCNGIDDDCDGQADENFEGLGEACDLGQGACVRAGVRVCVGDNRTRCDAEPGLPIGERCNGIDDDCDGDIDEAPDGDGPLTQRCYDGPPGTEGVSACAAGTQACAAGAWGACEGQVLPQPEICNGEDEDCDGRVDRTPDNQRLTVACYAGPEGSAGVGRCRAGVQTCSFGQLGACEGEVLPGAEICDSLDNDCNGEADDVAEGCACQAGDVRDCYAGPEGTAGVGVCQRGTQRCRPDGRAWQACEGEVVPGVEICDGLDNDCDGAADDAIAGVGEACVAGVGGCGVAGVTLCDGVAVRCDARANGPASEICNAVDDDCDGTADEGFNLGADCARGAGQCRREGVRACTADGEVACDAVPGAPAEDVCNQLDDDCDGQVDEDYRLGEACLNGEGVCARAGVIVCVGDGTAACDAAPGPAGVEICDGLDNDCDGDVDDGFGLGAACGAGVGACAADGVVVCAEGGGTECDARVGEPAAEQCDGVDNDCDGQIDEGLGDLGGCNTGESGVCGAGRLSCNGGVAQCVRQINPTPEQCDGLDNNCDGQVDEALGSVQCGQGVCRRAIPVCQDGAPVQCDPRAGAQADELCNGLDEDCDGVVDEDAIGDGAACGAGVGGCQRAGVQRCVDGALACDAVAGQSAPETCNAQDDDCDGLTDEDAAGAACFAGVGACRVDGVQVCEGGALRCPAEAGQAGAEVCDGADNDCDGELDEGFDVQLCGRGVCRRAIQACDGGEPEVCDPLLGARAETCNGEDDDCDGVIDEDAGDVGAACANGVGACRADGVTICQGGQPVCDAVAGAAGAERCDSLDNDCDGLTDEAPVDAGQVCSRGVGACAAEGRLVCAGGQLNCDAAPGAPEAEACDGADNDCDGVSDEALGAQVCGQGLCRRELAACANGAPVACDPLEGAAAETCNGQDDDCDGVVDDDPSDAGGACAVGVGACRANGVQVCRAAQIVCGAVAGDPAAEACDGADNDCDGRTDEGLNLGAACVAGAGLCAAQGQRVCDGEGGVICDAAVGEPADEVCDGMDNDCDGRNDEGLVDLGPCDTGNFGECAAGTATCAAGRVFCLDDVNPEDEACDGLDNDCDSQIDEGFGQQVCGQGVCRRVLANCDGGEAPQCDPFAGAAAETCDGLDNDCDGRTDEDAAGVGAVCNAGVGACSAAGLRECVDGALVCDAQPGAPRGELCNLADDDCDGVVDEATAEAQQPCFDGVGACRREAQQICVNGAVQCPAEAGQPAAEICDGVDNDCDAQLDEGFGQVVCGLGRCENAVNTCDGGEPDECDPFLGAQAETCNGEDDDCDGRVDEEAAGLGDACSAGQGVCRADGETVCQGGQIVCGAQAGDPQAERCNGLDDDCDSRTDEDANDVGDACVSGQGACAANGVDVCVDGRVECGAAAGDPAAEGCNLIDDDCDGATDEGLGTVPCGVGACARDLPACDDGGAPECDPLLGSGAETCNGQDDDCDGLTDEGLGQVPCGVGECARMIDRCVDGEINDCDPQQGAVFETCDDLDNDCDGVTDESIPTVGDACERGVGECHREGAIECRDSQVRCSVSAGAPQVETCDLLDNDCDTRVDEGAPVFPCQQGVGTCEVNGFTECRDGQDVCDLNPRQPVAEQCNGVDDDCDERADEGEPDCNDNLVIDACDIAGGASADCNANGVPDDCDIPAGTSTDCNVNGVPDECEGGCVVDEEDPVVDLFLQGTVINKGTTIQIVVQADDDVGVVSCALTVDGQAVALDQFCQAFVRFDDPGFHEVIGTARDAAGNEGRDSGVVRVLDPDDVTHPDIDLHAPRPGVVLDGVTAVRVTIFDETLTRWTVTWGPVGDPTINAVADGTDPVANAEVGVLDPAVIPEGDWWLLIFAEDVNGRQRTLASPFTVSACEPVAERCDGGDNDCDGRVDEDFADLGDACSAGVGECRDDGAFVCSANGLGTTCSAQAGAPAAETCDTLDNDCDGLTDEGFDLGAACSVGVGGCQRDGVRRCGAGGDAECSVAAGQPQAEICDAVDNDCDGIVDEDFEPVRCGVGRCERFLAQCEGDPNAPVCDPLVGAEAESCDGIDDDCDGVVDEALVGAACAAGVGVCRRAGPETCVDGGWQCEIAAGAPADEVCNDLDDDCDGVADEGDVCPDEEPPTLQIDVDPAVVDLGEAAAIQLIAADDRGVVELSLTADGEPVALDAEGRATIIPDAYGVIELAGEASDAAGNTTSATARLFVVAPGDRGPPVAELNTPLDDAIITGAVDVDGVAQSGLMDGWFVELRPIGSNQPWHPILTGDTSVDGVLGPLDPALRMQEIYALRVRVLDVLGREATSAEHVVRLEEPQQVGHFSIELRDLTLDLPGMPLTISRRYDTRDKGRGEFGIGWRLVINDVQVHRNTILGASWEEQRQGGFVPTWFLVPVRERIVTLVFPQGVVRRFRMVVNPAQQQVQPILQGSIGFEAMPGTDGTLDALDEDPEFIVEGGVPGTVDLWNFDARLWDASRFLYTTPEGVQFIVSTDDGLEEVTDVRGNRLTFGPEGITHSSGSSVRFDRDGAGRITRITDPRGNAFIYAYDAAGDLVAVTNRAGETTQYRYLEDPAHHLDAIIDPLGNAGLTNEYDASGRLIRQADAAGEATDFERDLDARQEIIRDALGQETLLEYDARGNITAETNPLGETTRYAYDADGNRTTQTDALGHVTAWTYTPQGHVRSTTTPDGAVYTEERDVVGLHTLIADALGREATFRYEGQRLVEQSDPFGNLQTFEYDASGQMLLARDVTGNERRYTRDANGRATAVEGREPDGSLRQRLQRVYDANGNLTIERIERDGPDGPEVAEVRRVYDAEDRLIEVQAPDGRSHFIEHGPNGQVAATVDLVGRRTTYVRDIVGRVIEAHQPDGSVVHTAYDALGRIVERSDAKGRRVHIEYDLAGRVVRTATDAGVVSTRIYDAIGRVIELSNGAQTTRVEYEAGCGCKRPAAVTAPDGSITRYAYDAVGNMIRRTDPNGVVTQIEHDEANRPVRWSTDGVVSPGLTFDGGGRVTRVEDALGAITAYAYNGYDRVVRVVEADGGETHFEWDELNQLSAATDRLGRQTQHRSDAFGRHMETIFPDGARWQNSYGPSSSTLIRADGSEHTAHLDDANRLLSLEIDGEVVDTRTYDAAGRRLTADNDSGEYRWTLDADGRPIRADSPAGTLHWTYDAQGRVISARSDAQNGYEVAYEYDGAGRLVAVTDARLGRTEYTFDSTGMIDGIGLPNGVSIDIQANGLKTIESITARDANGVIRRFDYAFDAANRLVRQTDEAGRQVDFERDAINRLVRETHSAHGVIEYTLDAMGNRVARESAALGDQAAAYSVRDRNQTFAFDARGNRIADARHDYAWNMQDRLIDVDNGTIGYGYDPDDILCRRETADEVRHLLIDPLTPTGYAEVVEERVETAEGLMVDRVHVHGYGRIVEGGPNRPARYVIADARGSVRALTDADGEVTDEIDYDAFGNVLRRVGQTDHRYGYIGEWRDPATGLYALRARWMDPAWGRFLSPDQWPGRTEQPITLNRYLYGNADPVQWLDRSGRQSVLARLVVVGLQKMLATWYGKAIVAGAILQHLERAVLRPGLALIAAGFRKQCGRRCLTSLSAETVDKLFDFAPERVTHALVKATGIVSYVLFSYVHEFVVTHKEDADRNDPWPTPEEMARPAASAGKDGNLFDFGSGTAEVDFFVNYGASCRPVTVGRDTSCEDFRLCMRDRYWDAHALNKIAYTTLPGMTNEQFPTTPTGNCQTFAAGSIIDCGGFSGGFIPWHRGAFDAPTTAP